MAGRGIGEGVSGESDSERESDGDRKLGVGIGERAFGLNRVVAALQRGYGMDAVQLRDGCGGGKDAAAGPVNLSRSHSLTRNLFRSMEFNFECEKE